MSLKYYICVKCSSQRNSSSGTPNIYNCNKGGTHRWKTFKHDGSMVNYRCIKCNKNTWKSTPPLVPDCPKGGNHRWEKMS
jgi:DNA-directed RNA polymerase subunit RPC12/RpoP